MCSDPHPFSTVILFILPLAILHWTSFRDQVTLTGFGSPSEISTTQRCRNPFGDLAPQFEDPLQGPLQQMAMNSLRYAAKADVDETCQGLLIYSCQPARYHEWEFRTMLELETCAEDDDVSKRKSKELTRIHEARPIRGRSGTGLKSIRGRSWIDLGSI